MKGRRSAVEVLFPKVRAQLFGLLFTTPLREYYVRELALRSHLALHTIQDELRKLSALGIITSRSNGFQRFYQANADHPLYPSIRRIVGLSGALPGARVAELFPASRTLRSKRAKPRLARLRMERAINWGTLKRKS
ncbi:MAG TPA: hypothetical protein VM940_15240 [Chthoniobacterales bacterium]|nr:hypothetical protein [Chthoniobacterales bacterium]